MRVSVPESVLVREIDEEAVILDLNSENYFGLDRVGARVWVALSTSESIQAAYEALLAEFDADVETLRQDLRDFVEELLKQGLIEVSDE